MICDFCYRMCDIPEGGTGFCLSRFNDRGNLKDLCYAGLASMAVDPVEKKPLNHFLPGTRTLSIAMQGCNFTCDFCQNHEISQHHVMRDAVDPAVVAGYAEACGCPSISYTYSEPMVWQDYMLEVASLAHARGLLNIMVTNGSFSAASLERILPCIDAYNIDLKGDEEFYRNICHASAGPVLSSIERIVGYGSHLEVTTMVIEGIHNEEMIGALACMLERRGVNVWHLSRFYPMYRMRDRKQTGELFLKDMIAIASSHGIPFIYPGNSSLPDMCRCPSCGMSIHRPGADGLCPVCGRKLYGVYGDPFSKKT